jgi:hypothetical protein
MRTCSANNKRRRRTVNAFATSSGSLPSSEAGLADTHSNSNIHPWALVGGQEEMEVMEEAEKGVQIWPMSEQGRDESDQSEVRGPPLVPMEKGKSRPWLAVATAATLPPSMAPPISRIDHPQPQPLSLIIVQHQGEKTVTSLLIWRGEGEGGRGAATSGRERNEREVEAERRAGTSARDMLTTLVS